MIRIAICDDKPNSINDLDDYLTNYFSAKATAITLYHYITPTELFASMYKTKYDIVFMDLAFDAEENDGIRWSKRITEQYPDTLIIILTAYEARIKEGYIARAFRFMTKPLILQELEENLDACLRELKSSQTVQIHPHGIDLSIPIRNIIYLEANAGGSILYTSENQYYCMESLLQWEQKLSEGTFFRCHKKYLINLGKIQKLENHTATISVSEALNSKKLPVSRRKWTKLREQFMKYDVMH